VINENILLGRDIESVQRGYLCICLCFLCPACGSVLLTEPPDSTQSQYSSLVCQLCAFYASTLTNLLFLLSSVVISCRIFNNYHNSVCLL